MLSSRMESITWIDYRSKLHVLCVLFSVYLSFVASSFQIQHYNLYSCKGDDGKIEPSLGIGLNVLLKRTKFYVGMTASAD